jgi:preprotein translocase SecE subunit
MTEEPSKPKRRVRNPDTFRERAQKAAEASSQPGKVGRAKQVAAKPFKPAAKTVGQTFTWKIAATLGTGLRRGLRFLTPRYFRNSWQELKLVTWPGWKQSRQLTYAVLIFAVVFGASIAIVDYGLDKLFRNILLK